MGSLGGILLASSWKVAAFAGAVCGAAYISLIGSWFHEAVHRNLRLSSPRLRMIRYLCSAPFGVSQYWWDEKHLRGHHPSPHAMDDPDTRFGIFARVNPNVAHHKMHRVQTVTFWLLSPFATLAMAAPGELRHLRNSSSYRGLGRYLLDKYLPPAVFWGLISFGSPRLSHVLPGLIAFFASSGLIATIVTQSQHSSVALDDHITDPTLRFARQFVRSADLTNRRGIWWWLSGGTSLHVVHHLAPRLTFLELPRARAQLDRRLEGTGWRVREFASARSAFLAHLRTLSALSRPKVSTISHGT